LEYGDSSPFSPIFAFQADEQVSDTGGGVILCCWPSLRIGAESARAKRGMSFLRTPIRGIWKAIAVGTLAGVFVGTIAGVIYGNSLERREKELREARRIREGNPPEYMKGDPVRAEARQTGLSIGIPIGGASGLILGIAVWGTCRLAGRLS
jgi:hypothetical protein